MVPVEGGTFTMGAVTGPANQMPTHQVTLSSYSIGQTEVTQELWLAVMGTTQASFRQATHLLIIKTQAYSDPWNL